jgi:hypothetical protein
MLRRRKPTDEQPARDCPSSLGTDLLETGSEETSSTVEETNEQKDTHHHHVHHHSHSKLPQKRSLWLTFAIGGIAGLFLAGLAKNQDLVNLELIQDLRLESLFDAIPAGILKEASDISVCCLFSGGLKDSSDAFSDRNVKKRLLVTMRFQPDLHCMPRALRPIIP